jgi:hypothetical protein
LAGELYVATREVIPRRILRAEFMESMSLSAYALAEALGVPLVTWDFQDRATLSPVYCYEIK